MCMIQRKQTLFILISLILTYLLIYSVDIVCSNRCDILLSVNDQPVLSMFFYISFILGFVSLCLYKRRSIQYRICLFNMYFQICPIIFSFTYVSNYTCFPLIDEFSGIYLIYGTFLFYGLAALYIKKDDDLIESINRI